MNEIEQKEADMLLCLKVLRARCEDLTELTGIEYLTLVQKGDELLSGDDNEG